jgi:glycosyltransferase involved in cell wall biosynthesis
MLINVTVPVYNEERQLRQSIATLGDFLERTCAGSYEIVIAENASTDRTLDEARALERECPRLRVVHLDQKGRGGALKRAWGESAADVLTYMDVDLSTDLAAFPQLTDTVLRRGFDLAIGCRLSPDSTVTRGWKRELISRTYNLLVKRALGSRFLDAQCGFKALSKRAAAELLPRVADDGWFFDTELLALAEAMGYRICELPVRWNDDPDSRVNVFRTAFEDIKGLLRLRARLAQDDLRLRGCDKGCAMGQSRVSR